MTGSPASFATVAPPAHRATARQPRNGLTTGRTVADAVYEMYYLEQACHLKGSQSAQVPFLTVDLAPCVLDGDGELRRHIPSAMFMTSSATV